MCEWCCQCKQCLCSTHLGLNQGRAQGLSANVGIGSKREHDKVGRPLTIKLQHLLTILVVILVMQEPVSLARAEDGAMRQHAQVSRPATVSRGLLEADAEPFGKQRKLSHVARFDQLWQQATSDNLIIDSPVTREIRALVLERFKE